MDGEKELVLGNKQLVGFFFVVVALCGVFFALGYMIGRNANKVTVAGVDGSSSTTVATGQRTQDPEPPRETTVAEPPTAEPPVPNGAPHTRPAQDVPPQTTPAPTTSAPGPERSASAAPVPQGGSQLTAPEPGATYLQVGALHRADAETLMKTLREQGYPTVLATSSKADFFRVLVGPYHQTAEVADTKAKLKTLGFADAFVLK
jgi:cell division septation protein DedD